MQEVGYWPDLKLPPKNKYLKPRPYFTENAIFDFGDDFTNKTRCWGWKTLPSDSDFGKLKKLS